MNHSTKKMSPVFSVSFVRLLILSRIEIHPRAYLLTLYNSTKTNTLTKFFKIYVQALREMTLSHVLKRQKNQCGEHMYLKKTFIDIYIYIIRKNNTYLKDIVEMSLETIIIFSSTFFRCTLFFWNFCKRF